MGRAEDALNVARSKLGYVEGANNWTEFGAWYGMQNVPWCAEFASYCLYVSGTPLSITTPKGFAYCPYGISWFKGNGRWHGDPRPGDLVFFDWARDGISDHVGIVEAVNRGQITTIEGNTSSGASGSQNNGGGVYRRFRSANIVGYGTPTYSGAPAPPTHPSPVNSAPPWPGRTLALVSPMMGGRDVQMWQAKMLDRGWHQIGAADGIYGPKSAVVCAAFQKEKRLVVDAQVGPITWATTWNAPVT